MFQEYSVFEIAAIVMILLVCYWWICKLNPPALYYPWSYSAAQQESGTGEPAELVISTLQPLQAEERESRGCIRLQVPVAETNHGTLSELVL